MTRERKQAEAVDRVLMAAYCAGQDDAGNTLLRRIGPRIHAFFLRSFRSRTLADDLTQVTLLRVHQSRQSFRGAAPVAPWVFAIADRVRIDELRRRQRQPYFHDEDLDDLAAPGASEQHQDRATISARVRAALDQLPESQRVVVQLYRFEGWSFAEIARELGTSEGAVRVRAFRALERLRVLLAELWEATR